MIDCGSSAAFRRGDLCEKAQTKFLVPKLFDFLDLYEQYYLTYLKSMGDYITDNSQ